MSIRMKVATVTFAGMLALSAVGLAGAKQDKVYICHNTASATNPVVIIHVGQPAEKGHITNDGGNQPHNKNSKLDPGEDTSSPTPPDPETCGCTVDEGGICIESQP